MFSFIHSADIHLDSKRAGLASVGDQAKDRVSTAPRQALEQLVDLALERSVDFVLIAGDVYDGDWEDYRTGLFLVRQLRRLHEQDIPVLMVAGNHDSANGMTMSLQFPANVTRFAAAEPQTWVNEPLRVAVHGQSFADRAVEENLAAAYPPARAGWFNIGLLHTSAHLGGGQHDTYAPCSLDVLVNKGYDYWALGHIHQRQLLRDRHPVIAYSGNLQGRHIRETGPKGCWVVEVGGDGNPRLEFVALDVLRWARADVLLDKCETARQAVSQTEDVLHALLDQAEGRPLAVRVELRGATRAHHELLAEPAKWRAEIQAAAVRAGDDRLWIERIQFATEPVDVARHADEGLDEMAEFLARADQNPRVLQAVRGELNTLWEKLPAELRDGADADGPRWNDPAVIALLIREAQSLLRQDATSGEP